MSEKGFVLISGKSAAAELFGSVLPECAVVAAESVTLVDCPYCAVVIGEGGEAGDQRDAQRERGDEAEAGEFGGGTVPDGPVADDGENAQGHRRPGEHRR